MNQDEQPTQEVQEQPQSILMDNYPTQEEPAPVEETPEEPVAPEVPGTPATRTQPSEPTTQTPERLEDPGEFKPNDYSFDVTLADGTTVKISSPEDFANIPKDADFGDPKNFMDTQAKYIQMVNGLASDQKAHEEAKSKYESQLEADQAVEKRIETMMSEFSYLESNGDLPVVPKQYENADWSDPEIAKQPGIKERIELLTFLKEENDKRGKVGLPPVGILEAKTLMENKAFKEAATKREEKEVELRKQRGAMVGGPSAPATGGANSDMIVGSGGSLRDI